MAAVGDDAMGLTQRELLMEMREDIKGLMAAVDMIASGQGARLSAWRNAATFQGKSVRLVGARGLATTISMEARAPDAW